MVGSARSTMFIAAACVAACSALVDLSGLQGGPDAGADVASDSSVLGGSSRCGLSSFSLCDDFERSSLSPGPWSFVTTSGVTTDVAKAARGARSMRVHIEGNDGSTQYGYVATSIPLLLPARSAFVRAFVFVPSNQTNADTGVLWLIGGPSYYGAILGMYQGAFRMLPNGGTAQPRVSATLVPVDRWACIELEVFGAGDAGLGGAHAWLDDVPLDDLTIDTGIDISQISGVEVGLESLMAPNGYDMWIDEAAVDVNRIGCAR